MCERERVLGFWGVSMLSSSTCRNLRKTQPSFPSSSQNHKHTFQHTHTHTSPSRRRLSHTFTLPPLPLSSPYLPPLNTTTLHQTGLMLPPGCVTIACATCSTRTHPLLTAWLCWPHCSCCQRAGTGSSPHREGQQEGQWGRNTAARGGGSTDTSRQCCRYVGTHTRIGHKTHGDIDRRGREAGPKRHCLFLSVMQQERGGEMHAWCGEALKAGWVIVCREWTLPQCTGCLMGPHELSPCLCCPCVASCSCVFMCVPLHPTGA